MVPGIEAVGKFAAGTARAQPRPKCLRSGQTESQRESVREGDAGEILHPLVAGAARTE